MKRFLIFLTLTGCTSQEPCLDLYCIKRKARFDVYLACMQQNRKLQEDIAVLTNAGFNTNPLAVQNTCWEIARHQVP